ncbi:inositol monophosphatase family protein [soil metagenome]
MPEIERFLEVAMAAAAAAGRRTLAHFHPDVAVEAKADASPVTVADREAEEVIRATLERAFPDHGVVGEEYGASRPGASHQWFLDPIDGTKSFVRGVPLYAVLIGLEIDGRVEAGVAHFPALGETVAAGSGLGTRLNGRRVTVRDTARLADAFVSFTDAASFAAHGRDEAWRRVQAATAFRPGWSDAYGHALVASGRLEVMLDAVMHPWDCGPFPVLLREAGGFFGDWNGVETIHGGEGVSCSRALWPALAPILALRDDAESTPHVRSGA